MSDIILKAALKYLESHPELIEQLIEALIKKIVEDFTKKSDPPK